MKHYIFSLTLLVILSFSSTTKAQVFMPADVTGDAYARITSIGYGYEVPDCKHAVKHILEKWDINLKKYVFVFNIHRDLDDDRCTNFDRQRTEIKTDGGSPINMVANHGDVMSFRWKFQLDSAYKPSPKFCHIHQIKAFDGSDADSPLMTISPRYGSSSNKLQIIFTAPLTGETTTLFQTDLKPFLGTWVEAYEKIYFSESGSYELTIKRVNDDSVLINYSNPLLAMWRENATIIRPKYGIYRSIDSISYLRDEAVRFADFSIYKGTTANLPAAPTNVKAAAANGLITITWTDNASNEDQFRIERSVDNATWYYLATAATTQYVDSVKSSDKYYYRLRAENTSGNSNYSNVATSIISSIVGSIEKPAKFNLQQNYPNPFNPVTTIEFTQSYEGNVQLDVFDANGTKIAELLNGNVKAGTHAVEFDASKLSSGTYFYRMVSGNDVIVKKLILLK